MGVLGGVILQLFTTGLMGGGVGLGTGLGVGLGCVWAGPVAGGAVGCCCCRPPSTGANSPSAQRAAMASKNRLFTVQSPSVKTADRVRRVSHAYALSRTRALPFAG